MIPYNTDLKKLALPEYGRLIQQMVDVCVGIEDRDERNAFAAAIVESMKSLLQEKGKSDDDKKYWDHLYIISDHRLDIDSPYGTPTAGELNPKPEKLPYSASDFNRRHYGRILQKMVKEVAEMENSEAKDMYVELLANHIKKLLVMNNPENANDQRVYADLADMSGGNINVGNDIFDLPEYIEDKPVKSKKKRNH